MWSSVSLFRLFGDDHDDVEATFGPLKPKMEEKEVSDRIRRGHGKPGKA